MGFPAILGVFRGDGIPSLDGQDGATYLKFHVATSRPSLSFFLTQAKIVCLSPGWGLQFQVAKVNPQ
jgi:hypothetical protein